MPLLRGVLSDLAELIGLKAVSALVHHFGGQQIYIPKVDNTARDTQINALAKKGITPKALASRFHLSEQRIRDILK